MKLNYIAETACRVLDKTVSKEWSDRKRERLDGCDKFDVLLWMNNLDDENLKAVALELGVDPRALDVTCRTLRHF